jgi:hypothetical protein
MTKTGGRSREGMYRLEVEMVRCLQAGQVALCETFRKSELRKTVENSARIG